MRRRLIYFGFYVLLGLLVHLAVVMACAVILETDQVDSRRGIAPGAQTDWLFEVYRDHGAMRISSSSHSKSDDGFWEMITRYPFRFPISLSDLPRWSRVHSSPDDVAYPDRLFSNEDARGWPFLSMRCSFDDLHILLVRNLNSTTEVVKREGDVLFLKIREETLSEWTAADLGLQKAEKKEVQEYPLPITDFVAGGALLPFSGTDSNGNPTIFVLPFTPIWPEFIANTLFYSVVLWLLIAWPRRLYLNLVRREREEGNQCPSCGYPIGTSPLCTECGAALAPHG